MNSPVGIGMYQIYPASKGVLSKVATYTREDDYADLAVQKTSMYPFNALSIGQSFAVPFEDTTDRNIRNRACLAAKELNKKFAVVKHTHLRLYEVGRIW